MTSPSPERPDPERPDAHREEQDLPQVFGRYLLLRRLSRGGMGEIFLGKLGEIQGFEKPVIKKILPNLSADDDFIRRFIDEAQVAIKLNHANIAQVYEVGKFNGDYFLAIEYVEGRDLRRLVTRAREAQTRLPPDLCLYVARELVAGLGYAHRRTDPEGTSLALVHCDISPPNVMVSFEGEVKVIDFGIAKSAIRIAGSNPNMGFGKFGYMAPEQLVRGGIVDRRTDIYAAGVVLYELLTGERLFLFPDGADYKQIARTVTRGEFTPVSERDPRLDPSLDPIVAKALAPRADDRYQSCEEFRAAVQQKLYQMNPTISSDSLAHFVKGLFSDEIDEERAIIASTRAFDLEEFKDELSGSATHTVTFARAGLFAGNPGGAAPAPDRSASIHVQQRKNGLVAIAAAAAMIGGGILVYLTERGPEVAPQPAIVLKSAPPVPRPEPLAVEKSPAQPVGQTVVVTPLVAPPKLAETPHPSPHGRRTGIARTHGDEAGVDVMVVQPKRSHDAVEAKFKTVKHEYDSFKGEYGGRLEAQWNAITNEIAFGHGDTKYDKVDAMLDKLRREMTMVRDGG